MKKFFISLIVIAASAAAAFGQNFPNVSVENQEGRVLKTSTLVDGKTPFIISFWSTTCKPCIKELEEISDVIEDWQDEANFRMIAVSIDDTRSKARAKSLASGRSWTENIIMLYDENQDFKRAMNVVSTPQVFIFDKNGKQVFSHTGYNPGNEQDLIKEIKKLK